MSRGVGPAGDEARAGRKDPSGRRAGADAGRKPMKSTYNDRARIKAKGLTGLAQDAHIRRESDAEA